MFKKLFNASDKASGLIPKIEKVMRVISFMVLVLDCLRFFKAGLEKLSNETTTTPEEVGTVAPGPAGSAPTPAGESYAQAESSIFQ